MATITAGMTIQASWFKNIDSSGDLTRTITVVNDANPIKIQSNSVDLASIDSNGDMKIKGGVSDNETI